MSDELVTLDSLTYGETASAPILGKAVEMTTRFMEDFWDDTFSSAERNGGIWPLEVPAFDAWCVAAGYMSERPNLYSTNTPIHAGLIARRNAIRRTINAVALYGKHGWPPFEIAASSKDEYTLKLVEPLLATVTQEVTERVKLFLDNKLAHVRAIGERWSEDARLPADMRQQWRLNNERFYDAADSCGYHIRRLLEKFSEDHAASTKVLTGNGLRVN